MLFSRNGSRCLLRCLLPSSRTGERNPQTSTSPMVCIISLFSLPSHRSSIRQCRQTSESRPMEFYSSFSCIWDFVGSRTEIQMITEHHLRALARNRRVPVGNGWLYHFVR